MNTTTSKKHPLRAQVHILGDPTKLGRLKRLIRRPILVDRDTGLLHELPTAYVYREFGHRALNTQRAVLFDLAFFLEWCTLHAIRRPKGWLAPPARVKAGRPPLSTKEIADLCRWCQGSASELAHKANLETRAHSSLAGESAVESITSNRRVETISNYLTWLIQNFSALQNIEDSPSFLQRVTTTQIYVRKEFQKHLNALKKQGPIRSLNKDQTNALYVAITSQSVFNNSVHGIRDRLIAEVLLSTGLRAGELLKLCCEDVDLNYRIRADKTSTVLHVKHRPNDPLDEREHEPAVKTLSGAIQISNRLGQKLISYITHERRIACERRPDNRDSPYLFINHSGRQIGQPIGARNLNRIISKLKTSAGLPSWISPHVMRHTHFTELADTAEAAGRSETEIRSMLIHRGHWSPHTMMVEKYTRRRIERHSEELIELREKNLES